MSKLTMREFWSLLWGLVTHPKKRLGLLLIGIPVAVMDAWAVWGKMNAGWIIGLSIIAYFTFVCGMLLIWMEEDGWPRGRSLL